MIFIAIVNYLQEGPGPKGAVPSVGVSLNNPSAYLRTFLRKITENSERRLGFRSVLGEKA